MPGQFLEQAKASRAAVVKHPQVALRTGQRHCVPVDQPQAGVGVNQVSGMGFAVGHNRINLGLSEMARKGLQLVEPGRYVAGVGSECLPSGLR